ncbi:MAG: DUF6494 family protein [Pseudomonadota bacterium]
MTDDYNMAIRKLLKQVGVTSQAEIERALRAAAEAGDGNKNHRVTIRLTSETLDLDHEVSGEIAPGR